MPRVALCVSSDIETSFCQLTLLDRGLLSLQFPLHVTALGSMSPGDERPRGKGSKPTGRHEGGLGKRDLRYVT